MTRNWEEARSKVHLEGRCRRCKATGDLDAAHTIPRSLGGENRQDSVIPLCRDCHQEQHDGKLDLLPLMTTEEQIEAVRIAGSIERAREILTKASRISSRRKAGAPFG